jgi:hypothetical protein
MAQLVRLAMMLGVVAACGGTPAKPAEVPANSAAPDCAGASSVIVQTLANQDAKTDKVTVTNAVAKRCTDDHWTDAAVTCINGAHDKDGLHECGYNHLTQAQQDKLDETTASLTTMTASAAMDKMAEFKDKMCACHDSACAERVADEMTKWSQEMSKEWRNPPKMTDADTQRAQAIGEEMGKCMQTAMTASSPAKP